MEIRCTACGEVGPAATTQDEEGIVLTCGSCGHPNRLEVDRLDETAPQAEISEFAREALERLIPVPGVGPRCPKCAHLLDPSAENCSRCGLSDAQSRRFPPGEAPWEQPPPGREAEFEQADLLWRSLEADWTSEKFENFSAFVRDEQLTEYAARRLRFRLVERPGDEDALRFLSEIATGLQSRILVAKAQAQASAEQFSEVTQRARTVLMYVTFVFWMIILAIVASIVRS